MCLIFSLWVCLILFLLVNLRTGIACCLNLWRKPNLRVLLSFRTCLAYVPDLQLSGYVWLFLDIQANLARGLDWRSHLNLRLPIDVDARLPHGLTNSSRTLAQRFIYNHLFGLGDDLADYRLLVHLVDLDDTVLK